MQAIQTDKLTKRYGKARGIEELTLSVGEGELFGFIGPNGAGKSTTIRTLLGLIGPTSGSAQVLGRSVTGDRRALLDEVGYLPSEKAYDAGMRVRDVLRYSASLRRRDCRAEAARLCERFSLDPARRVDELSLGNRKKVGIVCAMQHDPRLLILDEPTSGLDPLMQREFFALLEERNAQGTTVFLSSHVLSEIQRHCSRAAIVREGRLLACDRVEVLLGSNARRWGAVAIQQAEGSHVEQVRIELGGKVSACGTRTLQDHNKSEYDLDAVYFGRDNDVLDYNDVSVQIGRDTLCEMHTAGVLTGNADKILRGTVDFRRGAKRGVGHESEDVLLFSPTARNRTAPLILCGEEEVEGQHAASVGRLDESKLYYLRSRGLSESQARRLMVDARFAPAIEKIPLEELRTEVRETVARRLDDEQLDG